MNDPDDIPDPPVPPGALPAAHENENLYHLACGTMRALESCLQGVEARISQRLDSLAPAEAGALEHLCGALEALAHTGTESPNSLNLQALSPQKFAVQLTLRRPTAGELFKALEACQGWLLQNGYTPI